MAGRFSFEGYNDKNGDFHYIPGKDGKGNEVGKFFHFDSRIFTASNDTIGEFLRNSPFCEGSPNSVRGERAYYKELDPIGDAKKKVNRKIIEATAMNIALSLEGEKLRSIAILCGTYSLDEDLQKERVFDSVFADPEGFTTMVKSIDGDVRALVLSAKDANVITKTNGYMLMWQEVHLGNSDNEAVQKLMSDEELKNAIKRDFDAKTLIPKPNAANAKNKGR